MKFIYSIIIVLLISYSQTFSQISGTWEGTLTFSGVNLRIVFNFEENEGTVTGTIDSPDQQVYGIAVEEVTVDGNSISLDARSIQGSFKGLLSEDKKSISGNWSQAGLTIPLELIKVKKRLSSINRPQHPNKPFPYESEDLTFENKNENFKLAGTFTKPKDGKDLTAIILITGSGPQDRDETIFGHKPFLVISDFLTRNGYAVLRYDDRGFGWSEGDFASATTRDFANDVLAAIEYLKTRDDVNPNKIGLLGHSEGGMIAPMCAAESDDVAFIILLAAPGIPGKELLLLQSKAILLAEGETMEYVNYVNEINAGLYDIVLAGGSDEEILSNVDKFLDSFDKNVPANKNYATFDDIVNKLKTHIKVLTNKWFKEFIAYDPVPALRKVKVPVLAINGTLDLQVPVEENLDVIEKILKEKGNPKSLTKSFDGLNHLFQKAETGMMTEYGNIEETFSPEVLRFILEWLNSIK